MTHCILSSALISTVRMRFSESRRLVYDGNSEWAYLRAHVSNLACTWMVLNTMHDAPPVHDLIAYFHRLGFQPSFLARGMEGLVFDLGHDRVGKVWFSKPVEDVRLLQQFYDQLRDCPLRFLTPLIRDVVEMPNGIVASIEERLPGTALKHFRDILPRDQILREKTIASFVRVVTELSTIADVRASRELSLINVRVPLGLADTWGDTLAYVIQRRVEGSRAVLGRAIHDVDAILIRAVTALRELPRVAPGVIHGDICTENILVDPVTLEPTALIDFGFLTASGDPIFDAVVATLIYDMYSPLAAESRRELHRRFAEGFGEIFIRRYPLYRAAYALATATAYSPEGNDGHFAWCAEILNTVDLHRLDSGVP